MENKSKGIFGYRELDQDTINLINKVKLHGQVLQELVEEVKLHILEQRAAVRAMDMRDATSEHARLQGAEPERWTALARTHMQEALMFLTRAVAQPTSF